MTALTSDHERDVTDRTTPQVRAGVAATDVTRLGEPGRAAVDQLRTAGLSERAVRPGRSALRRLRPGIPSRTPRRRSGIIPRPGRPAHGTAVRLLAAWAFAELRLDRIVTYSHAGNTAARRVTHLVGFRNYATLRAAVLRDGSPADLWHSDLVPADLWSPRRKTR